MKKTFYTLISVVYAAAIFGQAGELDLAFNGDGIFIKDFNGDGYANCLALQDDGKLIIGGHVYSNDNDLLLMRIDEYGNPDLSFGIQGSVMIDYDGDDEEVEAIVVDPAGSIYTLSSCDSTPVQGALFSKFTSAGQLDLSFGDQGHLFVFQPSNASFTWWNDLVLLPDGSLLAAGRLSASGSGNLGGVLKITPNGQLDNSFGINGLLEIQNNGENLSPRAIELLGNNDFFILGSTYQQGNQSLYLAKFDASGNFVTNFGGNGVVILSPPGAPSAKDVIVKPDGKILITLTSYINGWEAIGTVQLLSTGLLDQSYGTNGQSDVHILNGGTKASKTLFLPDGKLLLTGTADGPWNDDFALARLQTNGALDLSFHFDGFTTKNIGGGKDFVVDAVLQNNGRAVLVGNSSDQSDNLISVARFLTGYSSSIDIDENHQVLDLKIYPNPSSEWVSIKRNENIRTLKVQVYNLYGKLLNEEMLEGEDRLKVEHLPDGLYILRIQNSSGALQNIKLKVAH
jgi:uncharacterized delta-60 repeat protein